MKTNLKKLVLGLAIAIVSMPILAQHRGGHAPYYRPAPYYGHHHGHSQWYPNYGWVIPAIVSGVVVYELSKPQPQVIVQQPVPQQQPPVVIQAPQSAPPPGFRWEAMYDGNCNCYKFVAVPN